LIPFDVAVTPHRAILLCVGFFNSRAFHTFERFFPSTPSVFFKFVFSASSSGFAGCLLFFDSSVSTNVAASVFESNVYVLNSVFAQPVPYIY
jgi:hypothetical protein